MNAFSQCAINTPASTVYPLENGGVVNADLSRPLGKRLGFPVVSKQRVRTLVVHLIDAVRPSTIAWFIVAVVVDAVNRVTFWAITHVCVKGSKGLPLWTNGDSTPTINRVLVVVRVLASRFHVAPAVVGSWGCPCVKTSYHPMLKVAPSSFLVPLASARSGHASAQRTTVNLSSVSAIARTNPFNFAPYSVALGENKPAAKSVAAEVKKFAHKTLQKLCVYYSKLRLYPQVTLGSD